MPLLFKGKNGMGEDNKRIANLRISEQKRYK